MKSVTEFPVHKIIKALDAKKILEAEGKSPEKVQQAIGETFKYEGEKLKHFFNSFEVAVENSEKLARITVVSFNEGEKIPPKATKVEDHYYIPEFQMEVSAPYKKESARKGGSKKGKDSGPKGSPWGVSPEELAKKLEVKKANDRAKSKS